MECFEGYVGVAAICSQAAPASGLYVTDLPGISLQSIELTADEEMKNFMGVWEKVEKRSLRKFRSAALAKINECFCISDITVIDCLLCANLDLFAISLQYLLGAELCYERLYSTAINRFTTIDKKEAGTLRNDFLIDFETELASAMKGIDLKESDCIDEITEGGNVRWIESPVC